MNSIEGKGKIKAQKLIHHWPESFLSPITRKTKRCSMSHEMHKPVPQPQAITTCLEIKYCLIF